LDHHTQVGSSFSRPKDIIEEGVALLIWKEPQPWNGVNARPEALSDREVSQCIHKDPTQNPDAKLDRLTAGLERKPKIFGTTPVKHNVGRL
jgi:hypothetical protein